jgi:hypothetical protein
MSDLESLGLPVDPADFYGVADAIAQVLREARDDPPDEALLSANAHRRLRMALTAYLTDSTDALRTQLAEARGEYTTDWREICRRLVEETNAALSRKEQP